MRAAPSALLRVLLASPAILALCSATATAQQSDAANAGKPVDPPKLQQVEIKGNVQNYDARRNDTATKIIVTQEEILKNGDTTISEVLKRLPGITLGGVQGRGGAIRMRGLGSGYTQILLNGEPSPPGFSLDSLSPDLIERIEIMRAATAEYSTQAVAGAINIVLKMAIQTAQRELKVGSQLDNGKLGASVNLQISDRKGPISYSLAGGFQRGNFEREPTQTTLYGFDANGTQNLLRITPQSSRGTAQGLNFSPRVNWTLGAGETITSQSFFNVNQFRGNNTERSTTLLGAAPTFAGNDMQVESDFAMARTNLNWLKKLAGGAKLDAKFGANWNARNNDVGQALRNAQDQLIMNRQVDSSASDKGVTGSGKYSTPFAQDHTLTVGWDAGISHRGEERIQRDNSPVGLATINSDQTFTASVKNLALFAQDEWNVTPRWSVYAGLRWEGLDTRSEGNSYAAVHNTSSVWSPVFQALWKLPNTKNDQIRFGLTRTYKAPSTNSLIPRRFTANNNSATSPDSQGNPNLKPELAWGLDLSFEHFLEGGGLLSASTFVRRIEDITRRELSVIDGLWVSMPVNDGVATTRGIELEAKLPLRSLYKTAPAIELRANMSRNWSDISSVPGPNNRLDQQTPFSGNLGLDYKMDGMPLTLGGNYSYQSGGPVRISANQTAYTIPKRTLDMYGLWKFDPKTQLRLSLANVLAQDNLAETLYADAGGSLRSVLMTPTSLIVRANLEMKF